MKGRTHILPHLCGLILARLSFLSLVTLLLHSLVLAQLDPSWTPTGSLNVPRSGHTATLLSNGKVLVAGGFANFAGRRTDLAEVYDPATGAWSITGSLNSPRYGHTATLLPNRKVLVVGGPAANSAELYEPETGTWKVIGGPHITRSRHTATLLPNARVLVVGGSPDGSMKSFTISAEIYDPETGIWSATGSLNEARASHTATLLQNGKVLVVGGTNDPNFTDPWPLYSAELYDPATGSWSITGNLNEARQDHPATALSDGKVLVAGGWYVSSPDQSTELYDPLTGKWNSTGALKTLSLYGHTVTLLPNGGVVMAGGTNGFSAFNTTQLYDPTNGIWNYTASLNIRRFEHTATLLPNGKVLAVGGYTDGSITNSAELYGGTPVTPSLIAR